MLECHTKDFEIVEYTEDSVIRLPNGLPGFEHEREFVLIDQPLNRPLVFVQSLRTPVQVASDRCQPRVGR